MLLAVEEWIGQVLGGIFIGALDWAAYFLVRISYIIFSVISRLDIFGGSEAGQQIFDLFTVRLYRVLGVAMIFVVAYRLIMMIVDPSDGGTSQKALSTVIKDVFISLAMVVVLPLLFKYMSVFQNHVIADNTIGAIVLNIDQTNNKLKPENQISLMVAMTFYHPKGSDWNTFYGNGGLLSKEDAVDNCERGMEDEGFGSKKENTICTEYYSGLSAFELNQEMGEILHRTELYKHLWSGMDYFIIIGTAGALLVAYLFVSYSIDIGTRAVKLGFLQLIAPIPVFLRIIPSSRKSFDTWVNQMKKTYIEIFIRLAAIFFVIQLIQMVPLIIKALWQANSDVSPKSAERCFAMFILMLGLLKFAQEAPELLKQLFAVNGGLFAGIDFKPGIKHRLNENTYAMKAGNMAVGALGGIAGGFYNAAKNARLRAIKKNQGPGVGRAKGALTGFASIPRGIVHGAIGGFKNGGQAGFKGMLKTLSAGGQAAGTAQKKHDTKVDTRKAKNQNYLDNTTARTGVGKWLQASGANIADDVKTGWSNTKSGVKKYFSQMVGNGLSETASASATKCQSTLSQVSSVAFGKRTKDADDAKDAIKKNGEYRGKKCAQITSREAMIPTKDASGQDIALDNTGVATGRSGEYEKTFVGADKQKYKITYTYDGDKATVKGKTLLEENSIANTKITASATAVAGKTNTFTASYGGNTVEFTKGNGMIKSASIAIVSDQVQKNAVCVNTQVSGGVTYEMYDDGNGGKYQKITKKDSSGNEMSEYYVADGATYDVETSFTKFVEKDGKVEVESISDIVDGEIVDTVYNQNMIMDEIDDDAYAKKAADYRKDANAQGIMENLIEQFEENYNPAAFADGGEAMTMYVREISEKEANKQRKNTGSSTVDIKSVHDVITILKNQERYDDAQVAAAIRIFEGMGKKFKGVIDLNNVVTTYNESKSKKKPEKDSKK